MLPVSGPSWLTGLPPGVVLRREEPADRSFSARVYAANRMGELALLAWPQQAKDDFLAAQHAAQTANNRQAWPRADWLIICEAGTPVGRLYVARGRAGWHLIEIGLLPSAQRSGLGSALIKALQRAAAAAGAPALALQVAHENVRAARLYARLGFVEMRSESPTHTLMRWWPDDT